MGANYLKKGLSRFTKISIEDDNEVEMDVEEQAISDFKEEKNIKKIYKKSRGTPG